MKLMPALNAKRYTLYALKGFTLIELLVVISIIAILMAVAAVSYTNAQEKGRDNRRKSDLKAVQQALEIYFNQNGKYPPVGSTAGRIACPGGGAGFAWGSGVFSCSSVNYMSPIPGDPRGSTTPTNYYYDSVATTTPPNQNYKIWAKIENAKDQDLITTNQANCTTNAPGSGWQTDIGGGTMQYFCVINP